MKYAIYDKAADAYLTTMEFDTEVPDNYTRYAFGYNEYITKARLLDTKEKAADVVTRTEGLKFMDKGRFVIHSFDDTLNDQYVISEAGNPTKVVDNITVDLNGTINVKYGTMALHWSTISLNDVIDRMNTLQKAVSAIYTSWNNTFDIYKVITIMDEKEHTHYQFINVTAEGLEKYSKNEEESPLNKRIEELEKANQVLTDNVNYHNECRLALTEIIRTIKYTIYCYKDSEKRDDYISYMTDRIKDDEIFNRPELKTAKNDIPKLCKYLTALAKNTLYKRIEELEKANYELGERVVERGAVANRLLDENNSLKAKVEAIKKEARDWKTLYENANRDRDVLTNVIDIIYDDLHSDDMHKDLKHTYDYVHNLSELHNIKIHNDDDDTGMPIYITAASEFKYIINRIITIMESRERNQSIAFASADEVHKARGVAYDIINICEADDKFEVTLKKFSLLYEAVNAAYNTKDDPIIHAFNSVLLIFTAIDRKLTIAKDKELSDWKRRAEEAIRDYTKCNEALGEWKRKFRDANKENHELRVARDCSAEIIHAIRNAITDGNTDAFDCIESRMIHDPDFNSDPFMAGVRENIKDICRSEKLHIANNDLLSSEIARLAEEKEKALERAEFYKRQANSVYGMTIHGRCCGKQLMADILSGKKIPIDKKKYDDLMECVNTINTTYDILKRSDFATNKPVWL